MSLDEREKVYYQRLAEEYGDVDEFLKLLRSHARNMKQDAHDRLQFEIQYKTARLALKGIAWSEPL